MSKTLTNLCCNRNTGALIGNALVWTAAILAVSALTDPVNGNNWTVTGILVACWFGVHTIIQQRHVTS